MSSAGEIIPDSPENLTESFIQKKRHVRHFTSEEKHCLLAVYNSLLQLNPNANKDKIVRQTALVCGRSVSSVNNKLLRENKKRTIRPRKRRPCKKAFEKLSDFEKNEIKHVVYQCFFLNSVPTVKKLLECVNNNKKLPNFTHSTLYRILCSLNFKFVKNGPNSSLVDQDDIIIGRRRYLRSVQNFRNEKRKFYYLGNMCLNAKHVSKQLGHFSGNGKNLIITHIGSESGFVEGALWVLESEKNGDYQREITVEYFESWFQKILPLLDNNSVIVLQHLPYNSRQLEEIPRAVWTKQQIKDWLHSKCIEFDQNMLKAELLQLVRKHEPGYCPYVIDEMAKNQNKTVLRLPPFHSALNPIEQIWATVKDHIAASNTTVEFAEVTTLPRMLLNEGISKITPEEWNNCVEYVKNTDEKKFWYLDFIMDKTLESVIFKINCNEQSGDDSDS